MASTWVFHRGSLGDSILLWPMLRALRAGSEPVVLAADAAKAHLAARELGVEAQDAEQRRFNELWIEGASPQHMEGVARVLAFVADDAAGRTWRTNAGAMFPGATIETTPGRLDRPRAIELARRFAPGAAAPPGEVPECAMPPLHVAVPCAPVVTHVGAGSVAKRWPMERWAALKRAIGPVVALAGEVEAERFSAADRRAFGALGGRFVETLDVLADTIRAARLFIGADTGPTHLAAALGVPTIALFGPTDPAQWGPIGPRVRVIRGSDGVMDAIAAEAVASVIPDVFVR